MTGTLKQYWRRILASSAVYAAAGWAVVEAATTIIDRFGLPDWLAQLVIALYVAGLPVTVYLVWRTAGVERRLTWPAFGGAIGFLIAATTTIFWLTRPPPLPETTTLAVLPCAVADETDDASRAEGFAEDVHARLSRVAAVKIISWNSSLFVREKGYGPRQIAEILKADRVVQCDMGSEGDRLAVSAQLVDPVAEKVIWKHDYDFIVDDVGTVVTELARSLLDVLTTPVEAAELERLDDIGTFSPEAYDLYLRASGSDDYDETEALLSRALAIDPNYAEAIILRATNRARQLTWASYETPEDLEQLREAMELMREAADKALAIDPQVIGARPLLSGACDTERHYLGGDCPPEESRRLDREECEILGDTAGGWACRHRLLAAEGKNNDHALERWLELEPTNFGANIQYMAMLWLSDRREEVLDVLDTFEVLEPDNHRPYGLVSNLLRQEGRLDEVLAWRYGQNGDELPAEPLGNWRFVTDYMNLGLYAQAEAHATLVHEARPIFMPRWIAELRARRGDTDEATELLDWAVGVLSGGGATGPVINAGSAYIDVFRDFDKARQVYARALADRDLASLCEADDACIFHHALYLHWIAQLAAEAEEAAAWLRTAEDAYGRMSPWQPGEPTMNRTRAMEARLLIAQDHHDEALAVLREAAFSFETVDGDLDLPIYVLDRNPLFDPVRKRPEFEALLADYDTYLEPMRQRALQATESGDWAALRQRTIRWIRGELD